MTNVPDPKRHKGGRPPGSKNKGIGVKLMLDKFEQVYKRIEDTLSEEQKSYYRKAFSGNTEFDPVMESELFMRLLSLYAIALVTDGLENKLASKDIAEVVAQYRMGIKDLDEMKRKRREEEKERDDAGAMVDPTRESTLYRFASIHR